MVNVNFKPSKAYIEKALNAFDTLQGRQGRGNDFLGWLDLPSDTPESIVKGCEDIAKEWKDKGVQVAVVIGIGAPISEQRQPSRLSRTPSASMRKAFT